MVSENITEVEKAYRLGLLKDNLHNAAISAPSPFDSWPQVRMLVEVHNEQLTHLNPTQLKGKQWHSKIQLALHGFMSSPACTDLVMEARNRLDNPTVTPTEEYRSKVSGLLAASVFQTIGILYATALNITGGNDTRVITGQPLSRIYKGLYPDKEYIPQPFDLGSLQGIATADAFFVQPTGTNQWGVTKVMDPSLHEGNTWAHLYDSVKSMKKNYPSVFENTGVAAVVTQGYQMQSEDVADGHIDKVELPFTKSTFQSFYTKLCRLSGINLEFPSRRYKNR